MRVIMNIPFKEENKNGVGLYIAVNGLQPFLQNITLLVEYRRDQQLSDKGYVVSRCLSKPSAGHFLVMFNGECKHDNTKNRGQHRAPYKQANNDVFFRLHR